MLVDAGMLESDDAATVALWELGMARLARLPNVIMKLTGLGTFVRRLDHRLIESTVNRCLEWFGPERCMWGSNFPVEKLWTDYQSLMNAYLEVLSTFDAATRKAVMGDTARRAYRLD